MKQKVLYVVHGHPILRPGGAERYALELYEAMRPSDQFEPILVARLGTVGYIDPPRHPGAQFTVVGGDPNQYFILTEWDPWDQFLGTYREKTLYTTTIADFLRTFKPDLVHIQHTHFVGYDLLTLIRRMRPQVPIVYTLHEFLPICHRDGQMVRTKDEALCGEATPRRCNECFSHLSPQDFFLRKRFIQSHFSKVDLFIAPSRFLRDRYLDWGLPETQIRHVEHGFPPMARVESGDRPKRNRFAFFGVLTIFKGMDVLLKAMERLGPNFDGHLSIHASGKIQMPDESEEVQADIDRLLATTPTVTFCGPYDHDRDMPRLMAETDWIVIPSIWFENSPLVIAESFQNGRPIICSDIGGMAEKVDDGVNGLHFSVGSPASLAEVMQRAATSTGLWDRLCAGIPPVRGIDDHVGELTDIYSRLMAERASSGSGAVSPALAG